MEQDRKPRNKPMHSVRVCVCVCVCAQLCLTPWGQPARLLCPWDSPDKNTEIGCHFLLQEIFPRQGPNLRLLCLLHWQSRFFTTAVETSYTSAWVLWG